MDGKGHILIDALKIIALFSIVFGIVSLIGVNFLATVISNGISGAFNFVTMILQSIFCHIIPFLSCPGATAGTTVRCDYGSPSADAYCQSQTTSYGGYSTNYDYCASDGYCKFMA